MGDGEVGVVVEEKSSTAMWAVKSEGGRREGETRRNEMKNEKEGVSSEKTRGKETRRRKCEFTRPSSQSKHKKRGRRRKSKKAKR